VGLMALSTAVLKKQCREHIESMIEDPEYELQTTSGDLTEIPYLVLTAVRKYYTAYGVGSFHARAGILLTIW
jgi:hypothetical protein